MGPHWSPSEAARSRLRAAGRAPAMPPGSLPTPGSFRGAREKRLAAARLLTANRTICASSARTKAKGTREGGATYQPNFAAAPKAGRASGERCARGQPARLRRPSGPSAALVRLRAAGRSAGRPGADRVGGKVGGRPRASGGRRGSPSEFPFCSKARSRQRGGGRRQVSPSPPPRPPLPAPAPHLRAGNSKPGPAASSAAPRPRPPGRPLRRSRRALGLPGPRQPPPSSNRPPPRRASGYGDNLQKHCFRRCTSLSARSLRTSGNSPLWHRVSAWFSSYQETKRGG